MVEESMNNIRKLMMVGAEQGVVQAYEPFFEFLLTLLDSPLADHPDAPGLGRERDPLSPNGHVR